VVILAALSISLTGLTSNPAAAITPVVAPQASTVATSGSSISKKLKKKIKKYAKIAKKYTKKTSSGKPKFNSKAAVRAGMSKSFAKKYSAKLAQVWKWRIDHSTPISLPIRSASSATHHADPNLHPQDGSDTISCLISVTGLVIATIAMVMAVAETFGVAAIAVLGYGTAAVATVRDCYLS